MKEWNYEANNESIHVTANKESVQFFIADSLRAKDKPLDGYVTLTGELTDGHTARAVVGPAITDGCKVIVAGKQLVKVS